MAVPPSLITHLTTRSCAAWRALLVGVATFIGALTYGAYGDTPRVHAGGIELMAPGARGLGRAGAMSAAAQGSDALRYNPSRLALSEQLMLGTDVQLISGDTCFDRAGKDSAGNDFKRVCNTGGAGLIPQLAARIPIAKNLGIGVGVLIPPGAPKLAFGRSSDGTIKVDGERIPSPSRYALISSDNLAVFPTLGIGGGNAWVRAGASFGWGVFVLRNVAFSAGFPGESPRLDARSAISGVDRFVPRVSLGLDLGPTYGFNVSSVFTWTADVQSEGALFVSGVTGGQSFSKRIDGVGLTQPMAWEALLALRYSAETWDVELDTIYQANSQVRDVIIDIPSDATLPVTGTIQGVDISQLPDRQVVPRRWLDQWILRAGAELSVLPDRLSVRAGVSYESNGVSHGYQSVDNLTLQRFGLHLGTSVYLTKKWEFVLAYAHISQPTVTVDPSEAKLEQPVGLRPGQLADERLFINAGTYRSGYQSLAFSVVFRTP